MKRRIVMASGVLLGVILAVVVVIWQTTHRPDYISLN